MCVWMGILITHKLEKTQEEKPASHRTSSSGSEILPHGDSGRNLSRTTLRSAAGRVLTGRPAWINAVQNHSGLACSCAARCFHEGQSPEAPPPQIHRCNWKRLALCVSLQPQCFCLHVQRDSDLYTHLKSSHSISWPRRHRFAFTLIYWLWETVGEGSGSPSAQKAHPHLGMK